MIHTDQVARVVAAYLDRHPGDAARLEPLCTALAEGTDIASRKTFTGHVTCSAVVVNAAQQVVHIRHNVLQAWLRPGGHLEDEDTSLVGAAAREVEEEIGIPADRLTLVDETPVDIDVHPIPANDAKGEPGHRHFDVRYVFTVIGKAEVRLQAEEVHDVVWLPLAEIQPEHVRDRVSRLLR
ncbi:8-oxo-dGTP pyrophosphatase MutT (NUDIX family) [Allocatelliglobosispora scoriae]|uniref:8-oxo-dGTP pyrophosphatase MutT (NUDIX family) n=1 Tax=Allocatelliglobosispora scoriae TaxID=643052 RepID=A0A841C052_9ACTN|nr:NUDIX domain-containing protein [Allocatelliglobosispora scoriae]MBB5873226.1 8-oxo-dGTP pyrophosphatase MutT (NUDIX family) [Allocatelliglobosispora scoriae]